MMDVQTFETTVRNDSNRLLRLATNILRQPEDAEEAVQTGLTLAWQKRDQFNGGSPGSWVSTIVKRAALDELRRRKTRHDEDRREIPFNLPSRTPDAYERLVRAEQVRILCVALGSPKLLDIYRDSILEVINDDPPLKYLNENTAKIRRMRAIEAVSGIIQSRIKAISKSSFRPPAYRRQKVRVV